MANNNTTTPPTTLANITTTLSTTLASTTTTLLKSTTGTTTSVLTTTAAIISNSTVSPDSSSGDYCLQNNSVAACRLAAFVGVLAHLLLAVSLIPQIIHLFHHGSRYIAGISYIWIIIRVLGLASLMVVHGFSWSAAFEFIALVSTVVMFIQIFVFADNFPRQQKLVLLTISLGVWLIGGGIILLSRKRETFLYTIGYLLLALHMLPQILLNSLLRTAKALSKFSILFLAMSDTLLFAKFYTTNESLTYLITSYYAFSFFLYMYLQTLVYADSHIQRISRSQHTVLAPGVEVLTAVDTNNSPSPGQDPQMFSLDDLEPGDSTDVVYQPVTSNKAFQPLSEQPPIKRFVWYATLSSIIGIEIILTIMIIMRAGSAWVILLPISIPVILGVFFLLRNKLNTLQTEYLRKIL